MDTPEFPIKLSKNIQVSYLGRSRKVRHPELIAGLVVSKSLPESVELIVQLDLNYIQNRRGKIVCEKIKDIHKFGSTKLYPLGVSKQEYRSLLCSLDYIFMPYSDR